MINLKNSLAFSRQYLNSGYLVSEKIERKIRTKNKQDSITQKLDTHFTVLRYKRKHFYMITFEGTLTNNFSWMLIQKTIALSRRQCIPALAVF